MAVSKHNTYFVEHSDSGFLVARTSGYECPMTVEEVREVTPGEKDDIVSLIERFGGASGAAGYTRARCGVYPRGRILGKLVLDEPRKAKDPRYLEDRVKAEFNIDPTGYQLAVLHPATGRPADVGSLMEKEFFICGAPVESLGAVQRELLDFRVFPDRMELGSVASIGALVDYHRFSELEAPSLMLEIGMKETRVVIINHGAVDAVRIIPSGLQSMIAVVQRDLGLKDEEAARRLFYSDSFDFKEMGPRLVDRLLRELQSSIGFYEVSTGLSIGQILCTKAPEQLSWLNKTFAKSLNVDPLAVNFSEWLERKKITLNFETNGEAIPSHWLGLFGLMIEAQPPENETK